ncbi:MAG: carbon-nitrogen hydrolase family protein [Pseudorhodoplanes sp.]
MTVAIVQPQIQALHPGRNYDAMERAVVGAAREGCDLVVLPELSNTGFVRSYDAAFARKLWDAAEPVDGPLVKSLGELAVNSKISVVVGLAMRHPGIAGVLRNVSVFFGRDGQQHQHIKVHLPREEKRYFEEGTDLGVVDMPHGKLGMLVCADIAFPEAARSLALQGAELIAVPMCAPKPKNPQLYEGIAVARAYENQAYVLIANRVGTDHNIDFGGGSIVAAPDGSIVTKLGSEPDMAIATLDHGLLLDERLRQTRFRDRRPHLYGAIAKGSVQ